ncbi:MAG: alpha-L-rhamnosidase N-terminal domain-containing protein [Chthonomonadales bacterium]
MAGILGLLVWAAPGAPGTQSGPFRVARWIAPGYRGASEPLASVLVRREFMLASKPRKAVLRIVGLGDYALAVNGSRVAPTGINQPWSQYERTLYYASYDVTRRLHAGANCIGAALGASFWHNPDAPPGRYNKAGPQRTVETPYLMLAELEATLENGETVLLGSDASWTWHPGPVTFTHVYAGEDYDARLEVKGWAEPGLATTGWQASGVVAPPAARLLPRAMPGFGLFQRFQPSEVREVAAGVFGYAFPQNMAAQLRVRLRGGHSGDRVVFRCGEHRNSAGRLFGGYIVDCSITTDGGRVDRQWQFFYLGMQFVEVSGAVPKGTPNPKGLPVVDAMELVHTHAALPEVGRFHCSSDLYNRIHTMIDWSFRSNMSWVMTDCPHREKLGWLECAYLLARSYLYRYDGRAWFAKIARDIADAQEQSGMVRTVAPSYPAGRFPGAFDFTVEWGAAAVMVPWEHYCWYGDAQVLRAFLPSMRRYVDYLTAASRDGVAPGGLGDWYDYGHGYGPGPSRFTPPELSATATWALCALTVARAAEAVGDEDAAREYRALHARIAERFQRAFQDPATRLLKHLGSPQCADAMALCAEVVPQADRARLVEDIVADLQRRGWQQTAGDVGHVYFIRALAEAGRSDVLHKVYSRTGLGSYGGILAKGLTSLPETWDAMMDGYQSLNHAMLGHVMEWFYGYVAGIRQAQGSVGWRAIVIQPNPGPLTEASAAIKTPRGTVSCAWRRRGGEFRLEVQVPRGIQAVAVLPSGTMHELKPGRAALTERD